MIKIENTDVYGWEAAIRGMRNPMNSWDKSDTIYGTYYGKDDNGCEVFTKDGLKIGENDLALMKKLSAAGTDHAKFLRMINVTMDITAPLYWWKEFDTYKVGTVANSCSTMHKIQDKEFTLDDFSHEHLFEKDGIRYNCDISFCVNEEYDVYWEPMDVLNAIVDSLNEARDRYFKIKYETMENEQKRAETMKKYWWQMIQLLPSSYNQKRTVQLNYAVLKNMYFARRNHKLDEWHTFCDTVLSLPYFEAICVDTEEAKE